MKRTVSGGTSPTAVTWWPSTTVEKVDEEPTVGGLGCGPLLGARARLLLDEYRYRCHPVGEHQVIHRSGGSGQALGRADGHAEARGQPQRVPRGRGGDHALWVGALRSHWKPSVETSGLKAESGM